MCKDCGCSISSHTHEHNHSHKHNHPSLNESKTIEVISKILSENDKQAGHNRAHFDEYKVLALNLMSSPGSGKTTLLEATIDNSDLKLGVIEGDLETNNDAQRIIKKGAPAFQITTSQACHLDAFMVHDGLHHLEISPLDLVFVENVGNLVCPASYDVGTHLNVVLLSSTEGDDKPAKYPVMFRAADLVLISKCDLLPYVDFNVENAKKEIRKLNPKANIIELDLKNNKGLDKWISFLKLNLRK